MKNSIITLILALIFFTSCERWIDSDINTSEDDPADVDVALILPAIEGAVAYYHGGVDLAGTVGVWMQHVEGTDRQLIAINNYNLRSGDINNLWSSMYDGSLMDIKSFMDKIEKSSVPENNALGVAKVLLAFSLGSISDVWGDVPYSEAFLGAENTTPKYDSQESIYNEINKLLDEAIADLKSSANTVGISNDFIYNGNTASWIKAAYSLKARYQMHLVKVKNVDYNSVIANIDKGITSNADNMQQPFDETSTQGYNPVYQFISQRSGYMSPNPTYDGMLSEVVATADFEGAEVQIHDPRNGIQALGNGYWTSKGSPVKFIGAVESMLLKSEAYYRMGDETKAKASLKSAYGLSIDEYKSYLMANVYAGNDTASFIFESYKKYLDGEIDAASGEGLLELIMVEKYKHMFLHPEVFVDYRRTGYPKLTPKKGDKLPRRYPYASDELQYNPKNTPDVNVFQRVWWDK